MPFLHQTWNLYQLRVNLGNNVTGGGFEPFPRLVNKVGDEGIGNLNMTSSLVTH